MSEYTAQLGDTWDFISYKVYGDEKYVINLMVANPSHRGVAVFEGGEVLTVPDINTTTSTSLPPWRQ